MDLKAQLEAMRRSNSSNTNINNSGASNADRMTYLQSLLDKGKSTSKTKQGFFQSFISDYEPIKNENVIEKGSLLTNGESIMLNKANRKNNATANDYRVVTESILKNQSGRSADAIVNSAIENGWYDALKLSVDDSVGHSNAKSIDQNWKKQLQESVAKNEFFNAVASKNGGKLPDEIKNNIDYYKSKSADELNFIFKQMYPTENLGSTLDLATLADLERRRKNQEYNLSNSDKAMAATLSAVPAGMISGGKGIINSAEAIHTKLSTGTPVLPQPAEKMTDEQKAEYNKKRLALESEALRNGNSGINESKNTIYQKMLSSSIDSSLSEAEILKRQADNARKYPALAGYQNVAAPNVQNNTVGRIASGLAFSTANMLPSIAANMVLPGSGTVAIGLSSGGNAYEEALLEGKTQKQALGYGILSGVSEAITEKLLGGIKAVGGGTTSKVLSKVSSNASNKIMNAVKKVSNSRFGSYLLDGLSEANEEWLQANLEPIFRNAIFDENNEIKPFSQDKLEAALLGFLSASVLNAPNLISGENTGDYDFEKLTSKLQEQIENQKSIAEYNNKAQYSIQTDSNGKKYVNVDTDQHIFEGVEPKEYHKIARKYILENFRGKIIGENESRAFVNKRSAEEYAYPANKRQESDIKSAKMKSSTELDNLMSTSQFVEHTDDDGRHPDATGGWDWYSVDFVVDGQPFNGTISVKNTDNGRVFYDMTKIRSLNDRKSDLSGKPLHVASVDKTSINPTIPQKLSGVKNSIRENTGNITENRKIRVPESELKVMKAIAKNHKIPFEIMDLGVDAKGSPIEGKYENGVIYVSPYAKKPSLVVFKHELTHYLEKDKYMYDQLLNVVKSYYDKMGETLGTDYAAEIRKIYDNYRARGKTLEDGEAERELVANFAGKYLFTDEKAIQYLTGKKPSISRSILNWIREQIAAIKGDVESELLIKAERMYVNALKAADKRAGIEGKAKYSTQYSLGYTTDNKPVVVVEDDILKGVPENKWIETVKNTISEKFSDGIPVSGRLIKVNQKTRNEFTNSKNSQWYSENNQIIYADKFKSANNLDDIVLASTNYINEDLKHSRKDKFIEFARGDVLIRVGDNDYSAKVIVGFTSGKQMVLYDVIDFSPTSFELKKTDMRSPSNRINAENGSNISVSNPTIPQEPNGVNTSISENAENDTEKAKYSLSDSNDVPLEQRVSGDNLLDAQDLIDTVKDVGAKVDGNGYITVYHRTNNQSKEKILSSGQMTAKEDGIFFSTKKDGQNAGYGSEIIEFKIPAEKLMLDDIFDDEAHLRLPLKRAGETIDVKPYLTNDTGNSQFSLSDDYDNAVEQYGAIPTGENPARDVKVPKQMNDDTKVRRTVRTAMEASGTPGELVDRLKVDIANDVYDYKVVSDKSAVSSAKDRLDKWGLEKCYQYWKSLVNEDRKISKNDLALAEQMYIESAHNGDFKVSQELMVDIAEEATRAGQNAQSIRLLKNLTPEGRIYKIDKLVYRIQKEIDRKTNGKAKTIEVDENLKKRMLNAKSQEEMDAIEHMVHKNIAKQMPEPTKMEKAVRKWNEWRYLAMLGNPRTHIRNIFGNALFAPMVNGKNAIGIALERTLSKDNRTKARLTAKDKATIEFAKSDFDTVNAEESKSSKNKYNESLNGLDVEEKVFKNKALEWARKTNSNLLEWEDTKAKRKRYSKSFAQFIKARGWDYQNLTDSQLDSARNYAMREAKRATFQDTSEVANALNKFSHQNIATEVLVDGLLPFKKTPINILKRGVEYSPFGIAKGITELAWDVKKGNMNASQAIDTLSCGLSGTAMMMVGVLLSSLGVLTSTSDDDKEGEFDKLSGNQEYALQFFGKSYTIDWIAPLSMPLFIGAEIENAVERGDADNGAGIGRVLDALTGISDPMFNLSMLQGINSSIKTVRYSDNPTVDLAANTVSGYLGQGIPTILGQTARTVDTTRRNSYYTPKDSAAGKLIDKTIKKTAAKIPGVSMLLEPYIDKWGNEQVAENWVLNAFENFASPGYYSENENDSVTEEMARLYKATSDTGVVPKSAKSSLTKGDQTYRLTEKEYTQYQRTLGKTSHEKLNQLTQSSAYGKMSDEEKAVAVGKMYRYAEESAKVEFYKGRGIDFDDTPTIKKFNEVEESGVDLYDYLYVYVSVKDMKSDKNANGKTISGSLKRKQISRMRQLGISAGDANKIYDLMH